MVFLTIELRNELVKRNFTECPDVKLVRLISANALPSPSKRLAAGSLQPTRASLVAWLRSFPVFDVLVEDMQDAIEEGVDVRVVCHGGHRSAAVLAVALENYSRDLVSRMRIVRGEGVPELP